MAEQGHLTRRELIRISATAAVAVGGVERGFAGERALKFFAPEEFAMLDELTELIVPADDAISTTSPSQLPSQFRSWRAWEKTTG
jgi:hypothetical protein